MEQGCGGQLEKHTGTNRTRGEAHTGRRRREGDAIPMGTGHPVRPALVTPGSPFSPLKPGVPVHKTNHDDYFPVKGGQPDCGVERPSLILARMQDPLGHSTGKP